MNNSTIQNHTMEQKNLLYAGFYGCILVLGFPLNALALWILCRRQNLKSPSTVFMVNLALSDLLLAVSLPLRVYFHATGSWPLNTRACVFTMMLFRNNLRSSCIFVSLISLDRLLAVVYPLKTRHVRTASNAWKAAALFWVLIICVNIPESQGLSKKLSGSNQTTCFILPKSVKNERMKCILEATLFLSLLLVNLVSTALVTRTLRKLGSSKIIKNRVNVMMLFLMNLIMFSVFFLPLSLAHLFPGKTFVTPLECLASANCCADPLLYYFSFDGFWRRDRPARQVS